VPAGQALAAALVLAEQLAAFPQACLRNDRLSAHRQWGMDETQAISQEFELGLQTLQSGETVAGAGRFSSGSGRHGNFNS